MQGQRENVQQTLLTQKQQPKDGDSTKDAWNYLKTPHYQESTTKNN